MRSHALLAICLATACERAAPPDHSGVVVTTDDVRLDGDVVVALDHGRVASGDRGKFTPSANQGPRDVVSKLVSALDHRCDSSKPVELHFDGALSAETFFILTSSVAAAGCTDEAFTVIGQPWRIPHHPFRGNTPDERVDLRVATTDAEIARRAASFATPPPNGVLVVMHGTVSVRQVMLFAQATPASMRRVYALDSD